MTTYKVEDIFADIPGDPDNIMMKIPDEICKQLNFNEGDTVTITIGDDGLLIQKNE